MSTLTREQPDVLGTGRPVLPCVNLLPAEVLVARRLQRAKGGLALAVVSAVGVVALLHTTGASSVSHAQARLDTATSQQAALHRQISGLHDVTAAYAQAAAARALLSQAMGDEVRYSGQLDQLSRTLAPGLSVWLTNASYTQTAADGTTTGTATTTTTGTTGTTTTGTARVVGTLTLTGMALSHDDVAAWIDALAAQPGLLQPTLQGSTESLLGKRKVVGWTATVALGPDVLSGRYLVPAGK